MNRLTLLMPCLAVACGPAEIALDTMDEVPGEGWADDAWETWTEGDTTDTEDLSMWDGATIDILTPASGSYQIHGEPVDFEAVITAANGDILDFEDIEWWSSQSWGHDGAAFSDDTLGVGLHDLTAMAVLPDGTAISHTAGGVKVQGFGSGLYAGMFNIDGSFSAIQFSCLGNAVIVVGPVGDTGEGDGSCLANVLGFGQLPLSFLFDLELDDGDVSGTAGADIFGLFTFDFPVDGVVRPLDQGFDITFSGDVPVMGPLEGWLTAERISLDSVPQPP